jgi:hypothetical protein
MDGHRGGSDQLVLDEQEPPLIGRRRRITMDPAPQPFRDCRTHRKTQPDKNELKIDRCRALTKMQIINDLTIDVWEGEFIDQRNS